MSTNVPYWDLSYYSELTVPCLQRKQSNLADKLNFTILATGSAVARVQLEWDWIIHHYWYVLPVINIVYRLSFNKIWTFASGCAMFWIYLNIAFRLKALRCVAPYLSQGSVRRPLPLDSTQNNIKTFMLIKHFGITSCHGMREMLEQHSTGRRDRLRVARLFLTNIHNS